MSDERFAREMPPWPQRLHQALMPDYNRSATVYWWLAVSTGSMFLLWCLWQVLRLPALSIAQVMVGMLLAAGAGLFPVRIPGTRISFGVGELPIFVVLLLHGPAAATLLAATEAAVGSFRTSRRWTSRLGSPAMATLAMFAAASMFTAGRSALASRGFGGTVPMLALALVIGLVYFVFNATLMSGTARLSRGQSLLQTSDLLGAFRWVGLAFAGSAVFATLLHLAYLQAGSGVFLVAVPLLALLLLALHFYYREQEAQEAMRAALAEFAQREEAMRHREADVAARHQREIQMSERRFQGAFTQAAIGMVLLDLDGQVLQSNEALGRLLGRRPEGLLGAGFAGLLQVEDRTRFVTAIAAARDVHFEDFEQTLRLLDGSGSARLVRLHCSFFSGPAAQRATDVGRPCLLVQVQAVDSEVGTDDLTPSI